MGEGDPRIRGKALFPWVDAVGNFPTRRGREEALSEARVRTRGEDFSISWTNSTVAL